MAAWLDDGDVRVLHGDCIEVMRELAPASIDAVVTDPPYGLEFMGKEWDRFGGDGRQRGDAAFMEGDRRHGLVRHGVGGSYGGDSRKSMQAFQVWCEAWAVEALRVLKPGGHLAAFGGTRTYHRLAAGIEDAGFEIRDTLAWLYGSGFPKSRNLDGDWQGWGTALKPAHEPITLARKPLGGTVAANVLRHGTGALNIDACRIEHGADVDTTREQRQSVGSAMMSGLEGGDYGAGHVQPLYADGGRWPANVVLDEEAAAMLDAQTGERVSGQHRPDENRMAAGGNGSTHGAMAGVPGASYADRGGASRFFYTAKAASSERNDGLHDIAMRSAADKTGRAPGSAGLEGDPDNKGQTANPFANGGGAARNTHPTVKPVDLMRWLIRLLAPPGALILDPFGGSGTTAVAARRESVRCIVIEREAEYLPIIAGRLSQQTLL